MARVNVDRTALAALSDIIGNASNKKVQVGWFESAKYDDGTTVAGVAAKNEYGDPSKRIQPRPFLRNTIESKSSEWAGIVDQGAEAVIKGSHTIDNVLNGLGLKSSADIKNEIATGNFAALQQSTIDARLSKKANGKTIGSLDKPLVEEAVMINTITYELVS